MRYIIQDWASNTIQQNGHMAFTAYGRNLGVPMLFDSFEDAWTYIDGIVKDEEDYQEYDVVPYEA